MVNLSEILGNERRMLMIVFLLENGGNAAIRDIAEYIVDKSGKNGHKFRKSVYVSLIQTHIPMLERGGFLRLERDVVFVNNSKLFEDLLNFLEGFRGVFLKD